MKTLFAGVTAAVALASSAHAATILSPVSATIDAGGPGVGSIDDVINQNGLLTPFNSGIDDFDAYLSATPLHDRAAPGQEWFSADGHSSATITFDLGQYFRVDGLAWWNDEAAGAGEIEVVILGNTVASFVPNNHFQLAMNYAADVAKFAPVVTRYVAVRMKDCPQPETNNPPPHRCGVGEAAFSVTTVPEPSTWAMMIGGFCLIGAVVRRRGVVRAV